MQEHPEQETVTLNEEGVTLELWDSRRPAPAGQPTITIQKTGIVTLNRATMEGLQWPSAVELMYSHEERIIGIRGVDPESPRAVNLRRQRRSSTHELAAKSFLNFYRIAHEASKRYPGRMSGDVLLVDLKEGGVNVSLAGRKSREEG